MTVGAFGPLKRRRSSGDGKAGIFVGTTIASSFDGNPWRRAFPGGLGFRPLVFWSLLSISGSCIGDGVAAGGGSVRLV